MKRFIKMEIFNLLNKTLPKNVPSQVWEKAYDKLAGILFRERSTASDREELYNALCYASTELRSLRERRNNSKKKKTGQNCF